MGFDIASSGCISGNSTWELHNIRHVNRSEWEHGCWPTKDASVSGAHQVSVHPYLAGWLRQGGNEVDPWHSGLGRGRMPKWT